MEEPEIRCAFPTDEGEVYMTPTQYGKWLEAREKETPEEKAARQAEMKELAEKFEKSWAERRAQK